MIKYLEKHLQYALHTTGFREQPLSDKSLARFRKRCYEYENTHSVDLYHDCVKDLSGNIAKIMGINDRVCRMDSMMIASNIRFLSRIELIYTCISKLVIYISKSHPELLGDVLKPYADPNDYNRMFYHQRSSSMEEKTEKLLKDSDSLLVRCGASFENAIPYQLFVRCLSEQTAIKDGVRRMRKKEDGGLDSSVLQNPSDPDATYRVKAGKVCRGYVANIVESVSSAGSVVTDYQYEQSIYSDSQFLKDNLEETDVQEEKSVLVTDGGYSGGDNADLAAEKNIQLITTALMGKEAPDVLADFEFKEDGTELVKCAAGNTPKSCSYTKSTKQCNVSSPASLYKAFPPEEARRLAERFEWHYTPKNGSWLDMAEIEIGIMSRQALGKRLPDLESFKQQVRAWTIRRNAECAKINWQFKTQDAWIKLARLYPAIV